jgi:hypothetical protein
LAISSYYEFLFVFILAFSFKLKLDLRVVFLLPAKLVACFLSFKCNTLLPRLENARLAALGSKLDSLLLSADYCSPIPPATDCN